MAGGRKEISPGLAVGSLSSPVERADEQQLLGYSAMGKSEQSSVSLRPDEHHSHNHHSFLPGERQEEAEEAPSAQNPKRTISSN